MPGVPRIEKAVSILLVVFLMLGILWLRASHGWYGH